MLDRTTIKKLAAEAGFDLCGVAPCRRLAENERRFRGWLAAGYQASLGYMERNAEKRFDPRLLVEGARTAVVCAVGYKNPTGDGYPAGHRAKIASYACARDYHATIKEMLGQLLTALRKHYPTLEGRAFVDTAPLAEKQLAAEAGMGWIGRQSLLVTPGLGTYVLLGELLLCDEAETYDEPLADAGCGSCRNCVESCPTHAIAAPHLIDAGRCISCHTVEREPTREIDLDGWIFGCDACQSCCPYNRRAPRHVNPAFDPLFDPREMTPEEWLSMTQEEFAAAFGTTPLTRSGLQRMQRNIEPAGK
ncbi:MAG: tRNA epoxyqueuosine(34) reductase QueG [Alistipes sp.]|nr:tRNA epoxyqueuosine(34) reductase QueG [Alistipes senegalensis]MCM1249920.1 tRNA epoxyqueuosine(34) reductase QueG [Alistipes sp.]